MLNLPTPRLYKGKYAARESLETYNNRLARNQMPLHNQTKKQIKRKGHNFLPSKPETDEGVEMMGIALVKWLIKHDMKEEAKNLLVDIRAGKVKP